MYMNGCAENESDFVKTKVNDDYIKTFPTQKESSPFLREDVASNNGSENDIAIASRDADDPGRIRI